MHSLAKADAPEFKFAKEPKIYQDCVYMSPGSEAAPVKLYSRHCRINSNFFCSKNTGEWFQGGEVGELKSTGDLMRTGEWSQLNRWVISKVQVGDLKSTGRWSQLNRWVHLKSTGGGKYM